MRRAPWIAAGVLGFGVFGMTLDVAGIGGLLYLACFVLATLPGWSLGVRLFGRRHPAAWIGGAAIGYAFSALAIWIALAAGAASPAGFLAVWGAVTAVTWAASAPARGPLVRLPAWTRRDTVALLLVLLLVPMLLWLPFRNLGATDAGGTRYYRAYFTADFLWHTALTAEMTKFQRPPVDPYLAPEPIHYYWTYYLVPAAVAGTAPGALADVQRCLKINALGSALLFLGMIFMAAWAAIPRAVPVAAAVGLTVLASSAEGLYMIVRFWADGQPLAELTQVNIDAVTAWLWQGLRIDGLARSFWYTPQHSLACALGLVALPIAVARGGAGTALVSGIALGASTAFNPLIGGVFALVYGATVAVNALAWKPRAPAWLWWQVVAVVPVALAVAWCVANQMTTGAGHVLQLGVWGYARHAPVATLFLSLGPVLVPALVALWPPGFPRGATPAVMALGLGLGVFYGVRLSVDASWMGFRGGQIVQATLPALLARFFGWGFASRRLAPFGWAAAAIILVLGMPTTVIDAYNAQDIGNRGMAPGFRWTLAVTPAEQAAFTWIRSHTSPRAVVQMDPVIRGRDTWTEIPSFAERRMAAGLPISLMEVPAYDARSARAHRIYATSSPGEAWELARSLEIDYLYMDRNERDTLPAASLDKFDDSLLFEPVFRNEEVRVYRVRR